MKFIIRAAGVVLLWPILAACHSDSGFAPVQQANQISSGAPVPTPMSTPDPSSTPVPNPTPVPTPTLAKPICGPLSFTGVTWPASLTVMDQTALMLGLNISGSFEGVAGWANLTNNFDGEGLSMGLLNQNLGTGSLQPMWVEMRDQHQSVLQSIFSTAQLTSLLKMLSNWQNGSLTSLSNQHFSPLDLPDPRIQTSATTREAASVQWAVANLYNGSAFLLEWQQALTALGTAPEYISIQIEQAVSIHVLALQLEKTLGLKELRSYLTMFDFVVQNGGIPSQDVAVYNTAVQNGSVATETERLNEILTLRLRHVRPEYVADVRDRKSALINGVGLVHGQNRNLDTEYCFDRLQQYP